MGLPCWLSAQYGLAPPASGRPVPDKYIYLEFCFLLPGSFGYRDIGCCAIYWVVQGFVAMWFVFCSFGACELMNGALECSVLVFICLLETDLRMLFGVEVTL